jgi:RimJ/RimL family protein N-acetyltransferase
LEVGWTFRRQFWSRGYATEAGKAALEFAFERLGPPRVISVIQPDNRRSIAVALRLGLRFVECSEIMGNRVSIYAIDRASRPPV